jgi:hypothetical protein
LKETQGDLEGACRLFLECEQIYAKVFGADHEETLDAAMRAQTVGEEEEDEEGRKEIATKEKRRIKRAIAEKNNKNSYDSTQSINRAQHDNAPLFQSFTCTTSRYYLIPRISCLNAFAEESLSSRMYVWWLIRPWSICCISDSRPACFLCKLQIFCL